MIDLEKAVSLYLTNGFSLILKQWSSMPPDVRQSNIGAALGRINALQKDLSGIKSGKDRAKLMHRLIDALLKYPRPDTERISCKVGCAGCCHQEVEITQDEAELLADLVRNGVKIDMEKLNRQAATVHTPLTWWRQPDSEKACLFLGSDNKCRIYQNRPIACRKYFVVSPPSKCTDVSAEGSITVAVAAIPEVEIAATAVMDFSHKQDRVGNMPRALKRALEEK